MSGCFPYSDNVLEFQNNLYSKEKMIRSNMRWDFQHAEIPVATGAVPNADKFDAGFFGIHERQGHTQDGMSRMALEKTVEAIFDAGLHPSDLENTKTGVYVGSCFSENEKFCFFDNMRPQTFAYTGAVRSMIAHRLSYFLKLKGPSFVADTACSSSFYAFEHAFRDLRFGVCDTAIVAGTNLCLHPFASLQFARLGVLCKDGVCKSFDEAADGYVRSEVIGVVVLQKAKHAKRNYLELIHAKTNCDGFKETGITFPSKDSQYALMKQVYDESDVSPSGLSYLEAHGTGTAIGDPEECSGIDELFTKGRSTPLLMGSVKSNIGHAEPASGIASVIKCIIASENDAIPPNINFYKANPNISGLVEGRMKVVTERTPFGNENGLIGINSFGFGGGNGHLLVRRNRKVKTNGGLPRDDIPRLVCVSGRTEEAVVHLLDDVKNNPLDAEHVSLLHNVFRKKIPNHLYRGFGVSSKLGELCRFAEQYRGSKVPFYLSFGELENWWRVGNDLMDVPAFHDAMQRIHKRVSTKGVRLLDVMRSDKGEERVPYHALGSMSVQIGIIDVVKSMEIVPEFQFGYSYGEILSAYFDDYLTLAETVDCALEINKSISTMDDCNTKNVKSLNIIDQANEYYQNRSMSENFRQALSSNKPSAIRKQLLENLSNIIKPKATKTEKSLKSFATAEYFVKAMSETISSSFLEGLEKDSILLKIGTFPVKGSIKCVKAIEFFPKESANYVVDLLKILGNLYVNGHHPQIARLYPKVSFPVSRGTRMISPHIKWKHDRSWHIPVYKINANNVTQQQDIKKIKVQLSDHEWSFVDGHVIDGRNLFPATGYLYLVWATLCESNNIPINVRDVVFENCKFLRATTLPAKGFITYGIFINRCSGEFEVTEGEYPVVTGRIYAQDENINYISDISQAVDFEESSLPMKTKDVYKELRLRGYNYKGHFRSMIACDLNANKALIKWNENWVAFLDNMLQLRILKTDSRLLYVPTYIARLRIPSKMHREWLVSSYIKKERETVLPVTCDDHADTISCGGVVIEGLIATSISRRKELGIPVLEKYVFVPNIAALQTEQSVRVNMQILLENTLTYKVKAVEIVDEATRAGAVPLTPIMKTVFEDVPLIQPQVKILSKEALEASVPVEDKKLAEEPDNLLVVASNLLERTDLLQEALKSLKENGFILSREAEDFDISAAARTELILLTAHKTDTETLVFLRKTAKPPKDPFALKVSASDDFSWIPTLKDQLRNKKVDSVVLYAQNEPRSGLLGLVNCLRREPDSPNVKGVFVMSEAEAFDAAAPFYARQLSKNMAVNIWKDGAWGTYRHLLIEDLETIESEHCFVNTEVRGDLSSLGWFQGPLEHGMVEPCERRLVYSNYVALNFRDIMTASGRINNDVITRNRIEQQCVQGFEFSGIDSRGNRVMGMTSHGAMSTLVLSDNYLTFKVPDGMSLKEAATLPVVYSTVIYAMVIRGKIKHGESILIHSGTGGVGQAAIRMALHYGCKIYTTVGTQAKRDFLKKTFPQLEDRHIGDSHSNSFERTIMRDTRGRGVDLVLNSLAEDKLLTSLRCVARGGRFLEIGKFDMANNNPLNLAILSKDVSFHSIMLDQLMTAPPIIKKEITEVFVEAVHAGHVAPLDATVFGSDRVEEAFRFMATGKHMGKVVIEIRKEEEEHGGELVVEKFRCKPRYFCDPDKTYIVMGGLGGFGLELADWLVLRGAKKILLTSRSGVKTGYQQLRIKCWRSYGATVRVSRADITTKEGCRTLIREAQELGEVCGIFNLAVVLADALFENQTRETFVTSFGPKSVATEYIDEISREMCPNLRDFVIFSSVSCGRGNAGQTNYGMSNSVMERICEQRKSDGFPALAIQWGAIGEVGLVAEMQEIDCELEIGGTLQQRIASCLNVLDLFLMKKDDTIVSSMVVAEKRGASEKAEDIVQVVVNILGLTSAKNVSHHSTLPELGMDSMTAVEIKQILERDFEIFLSPKDMRTMTLAKLKKLQEDSDLVKKDEIPETDAENGLELFFRTSIDESDDSSEFIRLAAHNEDGPSRKNIVIFPGVDGSAKSFDAMARHLQGDVFGLQFLNDKNFDTVQEMAQALLPVVEEQLFKDGQTEFTIIAYSFGSLVALEVAHLLEGKGHVGRVAVIDGSPALFKKELIEMGGEAITDRTLQTFIMCHLLKYYLSSEEAAAQQGALYACESWDERVDSAIEIVGDRSKFAKDYQKAISTGIYKRTKCILNYSPSFGGIESKVKLFRASIRNFSCQEEDYGLSEVCGYPVQVEYADGSHISILDNADLALSINKWLFDSSDRVE